MAERPARSQLACPASSVRWRQKSRRSPPDRHVTYADGNRPLRSRVRRPRCNVFTQPVSTSSPSLRSTSSRCTRSIGSPPSRACSSLAPTIERTSSGSSATPSRLVRLTGAWAIVVPQHATLVGRVGFLAFSEAARPEIAFLLTSRLWGRGLTTEGCLAALSWAFARHSWSECVAVVRPENRAAIRVCSKLGMRYEGTVQASGPAVHVHQVSRGHFEEVRRRSERPGTP